MVQPAILVGHEILMFEKEMCIGRRLVNLRNLYLNTASKATGWRFLCVFIKIKPVKNLIFYSNTKGVGRMSCRQMIKNLSRIQQKSIGHVYLT